MPNTTTKNLNLWLVHTIRGKQVIDIDPAKHRVIMGRLHERRHPESYRHHPAAGQQMITKVKDIKSPADWVKLRREYDRNNNVRVDRKTSRQHARWLRLRMMLRCCWQAYSQSERAECVRLYGQPINPPGA